MKTKLCLFGLLLITHSAFAIPVPLAFGPGNQTAFDAATQCIFGGSGVGGCPILVGTGTPPAATPAGAPGASYAGDSYDYTVGGLSTAVGGSLIDIVIDSNWAGSTPGNSEFLDLFQVFVNGTVEFEFSPGVGTTPMDAGANGTGNENWLLSGIDLSGFLSTDQVFFRLAMSGLTDGFEQFALTRADDPCIADPTLPGCSPNPMPEPGILLLLGTGLLGLAIGRRRIFA